MLLGYLRGGDVNIVKASYEHGIKSMLREIILCDLIELEHSIDFSYKALMANLEFASRFTDDAAKNSITRAQEKIKTLKNLSKFDIFYARDGDGDKLSEDTDFKKLIKLYKLLQKSGILEEMKKPNKDTSSNLSS